MPVIAETEHQGTKSSKSGTSHTSQASKHLSQGANTATEGQYAHFTLKNQAYDMPLQGNDDQKRGFSNDYRSTINPGTGSQF